MGLLITLERRTAEKGLHFYGCSRGNIILWTKAALHTFWYKRTKERKEKQEF